MGTGKRLKDFLRLQNMMLKDFVRQGLASRSLALGDAERLSRIEKLNVQEIARWDHDLAAAGSARPPDQRGPDETL